MALKTQTWETGDYKYQSWSNGYKIHLTLTEESTSTEKNTSLVSYKFWISNTSNNRFIDNDWDWSISIGGQAIAINNFDFYVYPYNVTQIIKQGQITVTHNGDGTLNMPYNVSIPNIKASNQYAPPAMSLSGTWALTTIPRASGVSCSTANIGTAPTIKIDSKSNSFTHKLTYAFGSLSGTIVERTSATTYTEWVLPTTFYSQIGSAKSGEGTIYCETYNGSTRIGTSSCKFTATVNEGISRPTITAIITDKNSAVTEELTGNSSVLVRYYSTAYVSMTATAHNGATLASQSITNGNTTFKASTATFENVESGQFSLSATDTRGFTTEVGRDLVVANKFVPYIRLTCNMENTRPDASGNVKVRCYGVFFDGSFGAVENTLEVECRYGIQGGTYSEWTPMAIVENEYVDDKCFYGAYASFAIPQFDHEAVYTFECKAKDTLIEKLQLEEVYATPVSVKCMPVFHWDKEDFVFEIPVTFNAGSAEYGDKVIWGDLYVNGYQVADFPIEYDTEAMGTNGTWYWTKWNSGKAECYGTRNFGKAAITTAWGALYESSAYSQNFPTGLFIEKPDTIQITIGYSGGHGIMLERCGAEPTSTNTGGFALVRPVSETIPQSYVTFHAIGRWK